MRSTFGRACTPGGFIPSARTIATPAISLLVYIMLSKTFATSRPLIIPLSVRPAFGARARAHTDVGETIMLINTLIRARSYKAAINALMRVLGP